MANLSKLFVAAGLEHVDIRNAAGNRYDFYAVVTANGDVSTDEVEIKGDDDRIATFIFNRFEDISLEANGVNFDAIAAVTGNTAGSNANSSYIPLGTDEEDNPPYIEITARSQAKTDAGVSVLTEKIWHKVQITSVKITQAGEAEFKLEMTGIAVKATTDILGVTFTDGMGERIATLLLRSA